MAITQEEILIWPASFRDALAMAPLAAKTYDASAQEDFLFPHRAKYSADHIRSYKQRRLNCYLDARNRSFVAYRAGEAEYVVGYVQFVRRGDDNGAEQVEAEVRCGWGLGVLRRLSNALFGAWEWALGGNQAADDAIGRTFWEVLERQEEMYWSKEDGRCRWHVQSMMVDPDRQRRELGGG